MQAIEETECAIKDLLVYWWQITSTEEYTVDELLAFESAIEADEEQVIRVVICLHMLGMTSTSILTGMRKKGLLEYLESAPGPTEFGIKEERYNEIKESFLANVREAYNAQLEADKNIDLTFEKRSRVPKWPKKNKRGE